MLGTARSWSLDRAISPNLVLLCIFLLGLGVAFYAPVWGAIVPDIASKDELASAITLGGVQLNLSGIVGPALAGLLLPLLGVPLLISVNAVTFLIVAVVVWQWRPRKDGSLELRESFVESFICLAALCSSLARHESRSLQERPFCAGDLDYSGALTGDRAQGTAAFRSAAGLRLYLSGNRFIGRSRFRASLLEGENLAERNHVDFHGDNGLRVAHAGVPAPASQLDGLRVPRRRGLVVGWIRALGRRAARHTGMGARPDERFPDHAGAGRDRDWRTDVGFGCDACWAHSLPFLRPPFLRSLCWRSGIAFPSTLPPRRALMQRHLLRTGIFQPARITTTGL